MTDNTDYAAQGQQADRNARMEQFRKWSGARPVVPGESLTHPNPKLGKSVSEPTEIDVRAGLEALDTIRTMLQAKYLQRVQFQMDNVATARFVYDRLTDAERLRVTLLARDSTGLGE